MEKLNKILDSLTTATRLVIFSVALSVIFLITKYTFDFMDGVANFIKTTDAKDFVSSSLTSQENISELITSQSQIDLYEFYKKNKKRFVKTNQTLASFSGQKISFDDGDSDKNRQYCQSSISVTFGYKSPYEIADSIFNGKQLDEMYLPKILGKYVRKRISAPALPSVISICHKEFLGAHGEEKLKSWMINDGVYEAHLRQGISTFYQYLLYLAQNDPIKINAVDTWKALALSKVPESMSISAANFRNEIDNDAATGKFANMMIWLSKAEEAKRSSAAPSAMAPIPEQSDGSDSLASPSIVLGTYLETYSIIAYSHVNETMLHFIEDKEYAIQRDVVSVVYGVEAIATDPSAGSLERIVATAPEIIYKNTNGSELGLFNDDTFDNFLRRYGKSVDQYMAEQVNKALDEAILKNSAQAKRAARRSFELQLASLAKKRGHQISVRYLDVQPQGPSLYESIVIKYLASAEAYAKQKTHD